MMEKAVQRRRVARAKGAIERLDAVDPLYRDARWCVRHIAAFDRFLDASWNGKRRTVKNGIG